MLVERGKMMAKRIPHFERGWRFLFQGSVSNEDEMDSIMLDLVKSKQTKPIDVSKLYCRIIGRVYNSDKFSKGQLIVTPLITTIQHPNKNTCHFIVTTKRGDKYMIEDPRYLKYLYLKPR